MLELKPCPFCGKRAELKKDTRYPRSGKQEDKAVKAYEVICPNHDCVIYNADNTYFLSKKAAVEAWNSRASGWISVNDRLPEKYKGHPCSDYVLFVYDNEIHMGSYEYNAEEWVSENGHFRIRRDYVTYWMPLPELPEMEMRQ